MKTDIPDIYVYCIRHRLTGQFMPTREGGHSTKYYSRWVVGEQLTTKYAPRIYITRKAAILGLLVYLRGEVISTGPGRKRTFAPIEISREQFEIVSMRLQALAIGRITKDGVTFL